MIEYADVIFYNGSVVTVNEKDEIVEAIAVKGNKIAAVGKDEDICMFKGTSTRMIDLNGRSLIPGIIDSHIHFALYGMKQGPVIDIDFVKVKSIAEIKELIRKAVKVKAPGEWIVLNGYDHNKLLEQRHPTLEELDEIAPYNPVRCVRCCSHMGVHNSMALKIAGITGPDDFAPGEVVVENGKMTGLLKENAHMFVGTKVSYDIEEVKEGVRVADKIMSAYGITSVCDAGSEGVEALSVMAAGAKNGSLKTRMRFMIFSLAGKEKNKECIDAYIKTGMITGVGNERFAIGPTKIMLDGSSSGPSSATRTPYDHDPDLKGILVWDQEDANEWILKAHNAGYQVTAHAVGDKAVELMVNAIENAMEKSPRPDCRHRIEHCGIIDEALLARIKALGIIPISNPSFVELNGRDYNRFYGDRVDYMFPCRSYFDAGVITAGGSDAPVTLPDPMEGLYGAVTRKDRNTGEECGPCQKITMLEAIRMYTYNGAYASFEEDIKGSLEVGKLADMVVLSDNILMTPEDRIKSVKADLTMIDGEIVYEREQ